MGYIQHHAIVVTGPRNEYECALGLESAHLKAKEICPGLVSDIVPGRRNGTYSFSIAPDGSKEGWTDSAQEEFIAWLKAHCVYVDWVLVQYGDDEKKTFVPDLYYCLAGAPARSTGCLVYLVPIMLLMIVIVQSR